MDGYPPLKVFIVGSPRSGTSILFYGMNKILTLPGFGESHVMPGFQRVVHQFRLYYNRFKNAPDDILIKKMSRADFEAHLFQYIRDFYFQQHGAQSWVDKTPTDEAAHGLPLIQEIFPDAKLIATKRTGIEVVNSHLTKFKSSFETACTTWANTMEGIRIARGACHDLLEVDQFDLANEPHKTARIIVQHLGRSGFADQLGNFFANERVEVTSTHDWKRRLTLNDVNWSPDQKELFAKLCGPTMRAFTYPW